MDVFLDPGDDRSTVTQIHDQLRDAIADGRLPIGTRLTPSRVLAAELELSRSTVTDAYERLAAEDYVEGRHGGGTVVGGAPRPRTTPRRIARSSRRSMRPPSTVTDPRRSPVMT